ncbi:hypothetical protein J6590_102182, partial [Homalodisca vitripennis]
MHRKLRILVAERRADEAMMDEAVRHGVVGHDRSNTLLAARQLKVDGSLNWGRKNCSHHPLI